MATEKGYWARLQQKRFGRRRLFQGAALSGTGLAAALLIGCARAKKPSGGPEAATKEPKRGGILRRAGGQAGSPDTQGRGFDPHKESAFGSRTMRLHYQGLLYYDLRAAAAKPQLAQRWEQPSQTEYLFSLQPGVKWHNKPPVNGRGLVVDDIVFSLERARTDHPTILSRSFLDTVDKIEAVNKETLRVTTRGPDASLLVKLAIDNVVVLAPEAIERFDRFQTAETVIGTGPFVMTTVEQGVGARYARNPEYWATGRPYVDELRTHHFNDDQTAWAAFLGGEIDIALVPGTEVPRWVSRQGANYTPDWYAPDIHVQEVPYTKREPMNDPRVTKALRLLVDHEEFIKAFHEPRNGRGRNGSIFAAGLAQWDLTHDEYYTFLEWKQPKNEAVRLALDLLRAAGFTRETPLKFELSAHDQFQPVGELLQAQWRRLSQGVVDADLRIYDRPTSTRRFTQRAFTYAIIGYGPGSFDPDPVFTYHYYTRASSNFSDWSDPTLDAMIDKQRTIFNLEQRRAAVREIVTYMIDVYPGTTHSNPFELTVAKPHVQGFVSDGNRLNGVNYEYMWLET